MTVALGVLESVALLGKIGFSFSDVVVSIRSSIVESSYIARLHHERLLLLLLC